MSADHVAPAVDHASRLREAIDDRTARVGIIGMGYVGLPLALAFTDRGFAVLGLDVDREKVASLAARRSYIRHIPAEQLAAAIDAGRFEGTADFGRLAEADAIIICVPTPLNTNREPDMSYVEATTREIRDHLRPGQLVVLESTTYPGTTDEVLKPTLEESGLACGVDFFLAFSPEREDPGNPLHSTATIPKVVGGVDEVSGDLAEALYSHAVVRTVRVSSARVAEATKLTENVFRAINIALVNELKIIFERMDIDVWEVLDAASTKPFGFMRFNPGPGLGGHCQDGEEFVFVRRDGGLQALRMRELAASRVWKIGDLEVLPLKDVTVLSFDLERGETCFRQATHVFRRWYPDRVTLRTPEGRALTVTDGHPLIVQNGQGIDVRRADALGDGRPILALRLPPAPVKEAIDLVDALDLERERVRVMPRSGTWPDNWDAIRSVVRRAGIERKDLARSNTLPLQVFLELQRNGLTALCREQLLLMTGKGAGWGRVPYRIPIGPDFARLMGYYLSEGCLSYDKSWRTRWVFGSHENELIQDLTRILDRLGFHWSMHRVKRWRAVQIKVSSNLFGRLLKDVLGCGRRSEDMSMPSILLGASEENRFHLLGALLNGDGSVDASDRRRTYRKNGRTYDHRFNHACVSYFSSSPRLFQQMILLLHSLGFTPTIRRGSRELRLHGEDQLRRIRPWLLGAKGAKLDAFLDGRTKRMPSRAVRLHSGFASTKPPRVTKCGGGWVYSLEVPGTETYVTSYGFVSHNCIPLDPFYLSWKAREYGKTTRFIELAGEINTAMPEYVVEKVAEALNASRLAVRGSRVLVLGLSYKPNVGDDRESPSYRLMDLLRDRGAEVEYHDPFIPRIGPTREHQRWEGKESMPWNAETISAFDVVVISTNHETIDYGELARWAPRIVDTRNAMAGVAVEPGKVWKA